MAPRFWFSTATADPVNTKSSEDMPRNVNKSGREGSVSKTTNSSRSSPTKPQSEGSSSAHQPRRPRLSSRDAVSSSSCDRNENDARQEDSILLRSPRRRINSRDIPRTYSGLYGEDDLLPFECHRQQRGAITRQSIWFLLGSYVTLIGVVLFLVRSWTLTHAVHLAVTVVHIHWLKGSIFDPQGEMNAMTIWEQLEARGSDSKAVRQVLLIVPTILCYAACHFANYQVDYCVANLLLWSIAMLAKLPFMNGVRIFGINRTVGIDDTDEDETSADPKKQR